MTVSVQLLQTPAASIAGKVREEAFGPFILFPHRDRIPRLETWVFSGPKATRTRTGKAPAPRQGSPRSAPPSGATADAPQSTLSEHKACVSRAPK